MVQFAKLQFSKNQVDKAGAILAAPADHTLEDLLWADAVLANWRACHAYPMNTFQATLRSKLKKVDDTAIVAQRLKRAPSIVAKLARFDRMSLARMQDIGGLRAVLGSTSKVRQLEEAYRNAKFQHTLVSSKDYIANPKPDGYRSVHLVYRYSNAAETAYNGLCLELQLRSRAQHAWATAVETMGTFLGQALKSGQGDTKWREFFVAASAAIAFSERSPRPPGFESMDRDAVARQVAKLNRSLGVLSKLQGFAVAATQIVTERGQGAYHLVVLNTERRTLRLTPYPLSRLDQASADYAAIEQRSRGGEPLEAVLVAAGPIDALKKAYPNYFLDTQAFVHLMDRVIARAAPQKA